MNSITRDGPSRQTYLKRPLFICELIYLQLFSTDYGIKKTGNVFHVVDANKQNLKK